MLGALRDEPRNGLGHDAPLLGLGPALDEHVEVELLGGQTFQRRLADGSEVAFIHVLQEPLFKVRVSQLPRVVVPQYALHVGGRQDFADHVEHCVVVESVADLLELVQQLLEYPTLNGVGRHEVED